MEKTKTSEKLSCYHCGEKCEDEIIEFDEKSFCCTGCKTVYELLSDNDLCNYYDIEQAPGTSLKARKEHRFEYLESEDIIRQLIDYQDEQDTRVRFYLPQVHCSSCVWLLEKLYVLKEGVKQSTVNFVKKELSLVFDHHKVSLRSVVELLATLGYEPKITLESEANKKPEAVDRKLYVQLGVSGFCFGNIMLLSFPEYLGIENNQFSNFFGYINLLLGLLVLVFGAKTYLQSAYWSLRSKTINIDVPISLGIIAIFTTSAIEVLNGAGAGYIDSLGGLIFFLLLGKVFQQKTYHHLSFERDFKSYFPIAVSIKEGEGERSIPFAQIKKGDRLIIRNGELIPADAMLMTSDASIDYSFVTGESEPIRKVGGELLYAGGSVLGEMIEVEVIKQPSQSYLTKLWNQQGAGSGELSLLDRKVNKVSAWFTMAIITIALGAALWWLPNDSEKALKSFVSVLIIACPCALALTVPFTMGHTIRYLGKNHFYLKNIHVIESLAKAKSIIFDKTGTVTSSTERSVSFNGKLSQDQKILITSIVSRSIHPISRAIKQFLGEERSPVFDFKEIPGKGVEGQVGDHMVRLGAAHFFAGQLEDSAQGTFVSIDGKILGAFDVKNSLRKRFPDLMKSLRSNYKIALLSGDSDRERERMETVFGEKVELKFNQSPFDKKAFLQNEKSKGAYPVMIGDGLNDAGALAESTLGIAVTDDISNFTPASDAIMDADQFEMLPAVLRFSKVTMKLVYAGFAMSFLYNIVGLSFAVTGSLSPIVSAILMPLSSISVVSFATLSTYLAAKKLR